MLYVVHGRACVVDCAMCRCWLPVSGSYVDYIYIAPILGVLLVIHFLFLSVKPRRLYAMYSNTLLSY